MRSPIPYLSGWLYDSMSSDVNLLETKTAISDRVATIDSQLRFTSLVLLGILLVSGLGIGSGFWFLRIRYESLVATKKQYIAEIANQAQKETLFYALKDRIQIVSKATESQKSYDELLTLLSRISEISTFGSISVDDTGQVQADITLGGIEEAFGLMDRMTNEITRNSIEKLTIASLSLGEDGSVSVVITLSPNI